MTDRLPSELPKSRGVIVRDLPLDVLPESAVTRLELELVEDGLGRPIRLPILVLRGAKPGPVFGLTAAVHGNELNGIPVLHHLFSSLDPAKIQGVVLGVIAVNIPGLLMFRRGFIDGADLNRAMPGRPDGNISAVFLHRFASAVLAKLDFLVDLHTASFGRVNSFYVRADLRHATTARMAYLQRPQIIVHNPPSDGSLRGAAMERGIPAITLEIGDPQRLKPEYIKRAVAGLRAVIGEVGVGPRHKLPLGVEPVLCESSRWLYTDHGGFLQVLPEVADLVEKGQKIAEQRNIFGDLVWEYHAPEAGIVVGKNVNPIAQTGARILHLGVVSADNLFHRRED